MSNLIFHLNNPNNVNSMIHGGMSQAKVLNHHPLTQWWNQCRSGSGLEGWDPGVGWWYCVLGILLATSVDGGTNTVG